MNAQRRQAHSFHPLPALIDHGFRLAELHDLEPWQIVVRCFRR